MSSPTERGVALLDVLVAVVVLGSASLSLTGMLSQAIKAHSALEQEEAHLNAADRVLTAMTLLTAGDLDRRLGRRPVGEFTVDVQRPASGLYRIALADASAPERILLVTVVHRAKPKPQ